MKLADQPDRGLVQKPVSSSRFAAILRRLETIYSPVMSPGDTTEYGGLSEQYKGTARAVFDVWSSGQLERLDELVAPDVVHHDPYDPNGAEGLVGMRRTIQANRSAFPDMQLTVEDQIAEADKVVTRWRGEMTHSGDLAGVPPTGRRVAINGITIDRFEDGKIVEAWRSMDMLRLLQGIGALGDG